MPVLANLSKFPQNLGKTDMPLQNSSKLDFALGFHYFCVI